MFCHSCGKQISDNSKFCCFCGQSQAGYEPKTEKMICTKCRKEFDAEMVFCDQCGMRLVRGNGINDVFKAQQDASKEAQVCGIPNASTGKADICSTKLMEISNISVYKGNTLMGTPILTGTMFLYADRIDFKAMLVTVSRKFVGMDEIAAVYRGMGVWSSIVIVLKSRNAFTFAGRDMEQGVIDNAIKIINENISH